jgi:hypothetical protein
MILKFFNFESDPVGNVTSNKYVIVFQHYKIYQIPLGNDLETKKEPVK